MGEKRKQRSENVAKLYRRTIVDVLWLQKMQDMAFANLLRRSIIKEINDG